MRPFSELAPAAPTNDLWRMVILGHFDAFLKGDPGAIEFMENPLLNDVLKGITGLRLVTVND